jgi:replicative DNA helicase Mcm
MQHAQQNTELLDQFDEFYTEYYRDAIAELAQAYPRDRQSLWVDYQDLYRYDQHLADDLASNPTEVLEFAEEALALFDLPADVDLDGAHVRVYNLPESREFGVGKYRSDQLEEYLAIKGHVSKRSEVYPLPEVTAFECQRCGTMTQIPQQSGAEVQEPHECQGCERQGPFQINTAESEWTDVQLVRLSVPPEQSKGGNGAEIDVILEDDATDALEAGDRATISGRLTVEEPSQGDPGFVPKLQGRAVEIEESDFESIDIDPYLDQIYDIADGEYGDPYDLLAESIAPGVIGMGEIKEALALQLFGGVRARKPDGRTKRGDVHVLLLGDPGTAKSTLLEDVEAKAPCSTFASGKGVTEAGMTASAVKDSFGGESWMLEAGALVLADGGIACVDELDKIDESVVSSMHESLSKQRVNVNKAGINATLPTRTSLLAAGNPEHGRFIDDKSIADQIDLGPTILSRFDLMFMIDDANDAEQDREIIEGMIENRQQAIRYTRNPDSDRDFDDIQSSVRLEPLRAWVAYAKQNIQPSIENEAVQQDLADSFQDLRQVNGGDENAPVPVTMRKLEGIQRLAEASARVRLSETVESEDIDRARRLIGRSMRDVGLDPDNGQLDADIVETGTARSQDERIEWIKQYIREHAGAEPVPFDALQTAAEEHGIGENQLKYEVKKLKQKGEIYEPRTDHYRTS